ncbi:MAG TPA: IgGFc-binding protein, partial [Chitinophagaceae bacterium]
MTRLKNLIATVVLSCIGVASLAQDVSNKGKEFWVGYGHHQFMEPGQGNSQNMTLYLSTEEQAATVTVEIDSSSNLPNVPSTWWRRTYNIPPYTVIDIETTNANTNTASAGPIGPIPKSGSQDARLVTDPPPISSGGAGIFRKKGIHITSNVPIVAYAHIYGSASSGATMLLPVTAWGYSYVSLNSLQSYSSNCYNWMYVVASKDNTIIEITPSVKTRAQDKTGMQPGVPFQVTLMKGQIYQVIGANLSSDANGNGGTNSDGYELSGTKVRSVNCTPIAVFAGSSRTANDASCGSGGGDNDNQQLFPQHAWGKRYLTAPFSGSSTPSSFGTSTYKVAVIDPTTVVRRNGVALTGLINGNYYRFESNTADFIEADKPIMVTQFMTGGSCLGAGGLGDPEMVVVAPIEQAIPQVGFYRNTKENISVNYVTLIVPTAGLSTMKIDGATLAAQPPGTVYTYNHPQNPQPGLLGRPYTVVVRRWSPASKSQVLISCDSPFNAITYGLGSVESYAYSAGALVKNLNFLTGISNLAKTASYPHHDFTAVNTPFKLSVLVRYAPTKITWFFSQKTPANTLVALSDGVAPDVNTSVDYVMNPAVMTDTVMVNGIQYFRYMLPDSFKA